MANINNFFKSALGYDRKIITLYKYQIDIQSKLLQIIKVKLPDDLANHILHCVISGKKLSLYTDSAVWSSQLRFYHHTILQAIWDANQGSIETLKIKIIPKIKELEIRRVKKTPSPENIDYILNQAKNQTDEKLKNSLLKLGKTLKNKSKI